MAQDDRKRGSFSRRSFFKGMAAGAAAVAAGGAVFENPARAEKEEKEICEGSRDIVLHNGRILTMDANNTIAEAVSIKDGRIVAVGHEGGLGPCKRKINLKGATVIPGIIDAHIHFSRGGTNEGYETRWIETAFSHAELFHEIAERAKTVPPGPVSAGGGGVITCRGGWTPNQFFDANGVAQGAPNRAQLNAAAPNHAVYLAQAGRANDLAANFFAGFGITTDPVTGQVSSTGQAMNALLSIHSFEDMVRGTADIIAYMAANGVTGCHDVGNLRVQPDHFAVMNALYTRSGRRLDLRQRWYRYFSMTNLPALVAYMDPMYRDAGDEYYRLIGVGEQIGSDNLADFETNLRAVAQAGWTVQQHNSTTQRQVDAFRNVIMDFPEARNLRWSLGHGDATEAQIQTLIASDVGVTISRGPARRFLDTQFEGKRIRAGACTDGTNVSWISPWMQMYFFVTRRNQQGTLSQDGQQISRLEALRLYTTGSAWFSKEETSLGSIEVGKLGDLAVLSDDYLTVPEPQIRKLRSVLTLLGGRIVHGSLKVK
jgi:predicted amidohydrolase YtcJ